MDKRFFQFVLITATIWSLYVLAKLSFQQPPKPPVVAEQQAGGEQGEGKPPVGDARPAEGDPEKSAENNEGENKPDDSPEENPDDDANTPKLPTKREWFTLGSLDKQSPYRLLVTLDSQGAALSRAELSSYADIENRSGYLGSMVLVPTAGGCRIETIGDGTPVASATTSTTGIGVGLKKEDILTRVDDKTISVPSDFDAYLEKCRPNQVVQVEVLRTLNGKASPLQFQATLTRRPVAIVQPMEHEIEQDKVKETIVDPSSFLMTVDAIGKNQIKLGETDLKGILSPRTHLWHVASSDKNHVEFRFPIGAKAARALGASGSLELFKRYELKPLAKPESTLKADNAPGYQLTLTVGIENQGDEPVDLAYRLDGLNGLPLEGWWYSVKLHPQMFAGAGARDVVYRFKGTPQQLVGTPLIVSDGKKALEKGDTPEISLLKSSSAQSIEYVGIDGQFFAGVMIPKLKEEETPPLFRRIVAQALHDVRKIPPKRERTANTSFSLSSDLQSVAPKSALSQEFTVFLGPKDPSILEPYSLGKLIEYGWQYAAIPAFILRRVLDLMYFLCGNYGLAIVLLTVVVRCCMLPFSLKQARSAAKMQELAPEMQKVREKFKDDMEGQGKAMQELYAKHNFNPFGGCLLMFFQLPVFMGLYRCLAVDIDLRDASLIPGIQWASNLAGPDRLFDWKEYTWPMIGDEAQGWFGPYFNVLPIITMVLFIIQQKLFTPPATDEQTRTQQKMMTYMTVLMGVMFYRVPAGLCVYIITSSLWGIAERKLLPKSTPNTNNAAPKQNIKQEQAARAKQLNKAKKKK